MCLFRTNLVVPFAKDLPASINLQVFFGQHWDRPSSCWIRFYWATPLQLFVAVLSCPYDPLRTKERWSLLCSKTPRDFWHILPERGLFLSWWFGLSRTEALYLSHLSLYRHRLRAHLRHGSPCLPTLDGNCTKVYSSPKVHFHLIFFLFFYFSQHLNQFWFLLKSQIIHCLFRCILVGFLLSPIRLLSRSDPQSLNPRISYLIWSLNQQCRVLLLWLWDFFGHSRKRYWFFCRRFHWYVLNPLFSLYILY